MLLGLMRGAYNAGPTPERADDFAFALRIWYEALQRWPIDDAIDALELMLNGGQVRYPSLTEMIEAIQTVRRNRAMATVHPAIGPAEGIPYWDPIAQRAIWDGYVREIMRLRRCSRAEAEDHGRESEVLRPWMVPVSGDA